MFHIIPWSHLIKLHLIEDNLPLIDKEAIRSHYIKDIINCNSLWSQREDNSFMVVCVCNSVIRLFPETNHVGDKIFRSKHEIILERYFYVFEKSNTSWKYLNTNTFLYGKLKYKYLKKVFKYFQIQLNLTPCLKWTDSIVHVWKMWESVTVTE